MGRALLGRRLAGSAPAVEVNPSPMEGSWVARGQRLVHGRAIGAYIGNSPNDPLYDFLRSNCPATSSVAILVEPVREYFDALRDAYDDLPTVRLENIAIAEEEGERDFYRLAPGVDPTEHGHPE